MRQESEGITVKTDCYSFATLMWDCATRGYAWQGLGLLHVRSALVDLVALGVWLFAAGLDDPHPGDDESRRREHAAANAASEAGATQLAEREHKRSVVDTHARMHWRAQHGCESCLERCTSDGIWRLVVS